MYEDYFGLERPPFKITPDTSLFYEGGKRGDILAALVYAIQRGEGIVKVVGEVGSGKTMLCRMLQLKLPKSVEIVYIANPSVSPEDILFVIAHELSLPVSRDASKHKVMHSLQDYLLKRHMENRQVVLFIEEAQGMPLETLEEIRLLSNLETDQNKLLQIILFGQPELDENLAKQSIRQLRERITHSFNLEPLTREEIYNYLNFRMREVGYRGPELINRAMAKKVEQHSGGLLRRINIIADKILLSAYAEGTHNLSAKHVSAAVNDSAFDSVATRRGGAIWWFALVLLAALLFALYQTRGEWLSVAASVGISEPADPRVDEQPLATIESPSSQAWQPKVAAEAPDSPNMPSISSNEKTAVMGLQAKLQAATPALEVVAVQVADGGADSPADSETADLAVLGEPSAMASPQTASVDDANSRAAQAPLESAVQPAEPDSAAEAATLDDAQSTGVALTVGDIKAKYASVGVDDDYDQWLKDKLEASRKWLSELDGSKVSIQVMMRKKSAARELVYYLRNDWPLDISKTYLYEVKLENRTIYRVLYSDFDSVAQGKRQIENLPDSVKNNSPYLHSINRLQKALL